MALLEVKREMFPAILNAEIKLKDARNVGNADHSYLMEELKAGFKDLKARTKGEAESRVFKSIKESPQKKETPEPVQERGSVEEVILW